MAAKAKRLAERKWLRLQARPVQPYAGSAIRSAQARSATRHA